MAMYIFTKSFKTFVEIMKSKFRAVDLSREQRQGCHNWITERHQLNRYIFISYGLGSTQLFIISVFMLGWTMRNGV